MLSLFQLLMTSSEFTEHFLELNKVYYPISGRNNFTVLLASVVDWQDYINEKCPSLCRMFFFIYFFKWGQIYRNRWIGSN